jgi:hypothetical protein
MIALLNNYITKNYDEINRYTRYFVSRLNSQLDIDTIINNAYIKASESKYQYKEEHEAKAMFLHLIKCELLWQSDSKKEIINSVENEYIPDSIDDSLENEIKFSERLEILENYRGQITDKIKLIFFETYYDKQISTGRTIAKHFGISHTSAHFMINEMLESIKHFEKYGQYK